jgi:hypothetical protein
MMSKQQRSQRDSSGTIRNIPAFVRSYLASDSGKHALARKPYRARDNETGKFHMVWRNPAIAVAFQEALA